MPGKPSASLPIASAMAGTMTLSDGDGDRMSGRSSPTVSSAAR